MSDAAPTPSVEAAAERLEVLAPGYLDLVRRSSRRLAHRDNAVVTVLTALADVEDTADFDLEAPTLSRRRSGRLLKVVVKRLISWYLRYLTVQVGAFSAAVTRFGVQIVERGDQLEARTAALADEVQRLRLRLDRLEGEADRAAALPGPPAGEGGA